MAREVITLVGTVAGAYFGQPGLGYAIGSAIGNTVDPLVIKSQGPQLGDLTVQFSTWGTMIPYLYGSMRMAGNVIWSSGLKESAQKDESGGKGGGPVNETTTYTYAIDIATSLCDCSDENEIIGIRKIWANGNLIYNAGIDANIETIIQSQKFSSDFNIYIGSEIQLPDPTIEAYLGIGNVPAYRGQAYIVFNNFQLANYGNRVPNLEFEVIKAGNNAFKKTDLASVTAGDAYVFSRRVSSISTIDSPIMFTVPNNPAPQKIEAHQIFEGKEVLLYTLPQPAIPFIETYFYIGVSDDPNALLLHAYLGSSISKLYWTTKNSFFEVVGATIDQTNTRYAKKGEHLYLAYAAGSKIVFKYRISPSSLNGKSLPLSNNVASMFELNGIIYCLELVAAPTITRIDSDSMNIISTDVYSGTSITISSWPKIYVSENESIFLLNNNDVYHLSNGVFTSIFSLTDTINIGVNFAVSNDAKTLIYSGMTGSGETSVVSAYISSTGIPIRDIVIDQCIRSGVVDYDVSELDTSVRGYAVKRQETARESIDQLQKYGYFDAVESDGKLKFPMRGASPTLTIPYVDIGAHLFEDAADSILTEARTQETELPKRVSVNYFNSSSDYQTGSEHAQRLITKATNEVSVGLAIAMDSDKAAQISDVLLFDAYNSRTNFTFSTTGKYSIIEPADTLYVEHPNGAYILRIISKDDSGQIKKFTAVQENIAGYSSSASGGSGGQSQNQVSGTGPTLYIYLDIPLIRDEDNNSGFYAVMTGLLDGWHGASLFKSFDDLSFLSIGSVVNSASIGYANTVLGNFTGGNIFDEANTVDVTIYTGELTSSDYLTVLNGGNICVLGSEILQFKTATLIGTLKYRLSGLLRGRRGTEQYINSHTNSDQFSLMSVAGTLRPDAGANEINMARYYKPVSIGQKQTDVTSQEFKNTAIGLKPYSPVNFSGGKQVNGDFIINWIRRTRIDREWRDNVDVPIGETTESYEIDIMSGVTVKRTMTSATPTVTYTAAMQTTDFGGAQSTLSVNVYQMSATVGRGFPGSKIY